MKIVETIHEPVDSVKIELEFVEKSGHTKNYYLWVDNDVEAENMVRLINAAGSPISKWFISALTSKIAQSVENRFLAVDEVVELKINVYHVTIVKDKVIY